MPRMRLNPDEVRKLPYAEPGRSYYMMDQKLSNFGIRVHDNRKTWVVRYQGRTITLGPAEGAAAVGLLNARRMAEKRILELKQGLSREVTELFIEHARRLLAPAEYERVLASVELELPRAMEARGALLRRRLERLTLADLFESLREKSLEELGETPSVRSKLGRWRRYILPELGTTRIRDISAEDIERLKRKMKGTPTAFNAVVDHLREAFNRCARFKPAWRLDNPAAEVTKYPTYPRERVLSSQERSRLLAAFDLARRRGLTSEASLSVCLLTLATGCRPGEPLRIRRDWVEISDDLQSGVVRFPTQKGDRPGRKRGRILPLGPLAVQEVLRQPEIPGNPFLFPGRAPGKPLSYGAVRATWRTLFRIARIEGAVPYSARHTAATEAEEANVPLATASQLLGHHQVQTTHKHYVKPKEVNLTRAACALERHLIHQVAPTLELIREIGEGAAHP